MLGPVDVTENESDTYTSSNISKFAWAEDPKEQSNGLLFVEFQNGGQYVYYGVPDSIFQDLEARAYIHEEFEDSVGEFFIAEVRNEFTREGKDYDNFRNIIGD